MSFLFRYLRFHDIIGGIHVPVDDGVDKLNRKYTLLVFLFLALPIFTKQYIGDPIECFAPVYFAEHQARYINSYCWTQSTYYMVPIGDPEDDADQQEPPDRIMPDEVDYFIGFETVTHIGNERLRRVRVSYYQWAPLILLAQGLCFYIPFLIWNSCANNAGVKLRRLLKKASDIASLPPGCQQREALLAEFVDQFHTLVTGEAGWCADLQCGGGSAGALGLAPVPGPAGSSSSAGSSSASSGGRNAEDQSALQTRRADERRSTHSSNRQHQQQQDNSASCCLVSIPIIGHLLACCLKPCPTFGLVVGPSKYLCLLYLAVKFAYVFNVGLQFFLLGQFLGRGYLRHGLELVNRLLVNGEWWASPRFPLSTLCQVRADMSGGLRSYTCQCVLPINVFNEKIFSVVWFYMAFLLPLNVLSLLFWIYRTFETNRISYIRLCLWRTRLVELNQIHRTVRRLSQSYLGWDGVFLLRLIEHNHGSIMATLIMSRLWEFYANQMKLQEDANQLALANSAHNTLANLTGGQQGTGQAAIGGPAAIGAPPPVHQQPQLHSSASNHHHHHHNHAGGHAGQQHLGGHHAMGHGNPQQFSNNNNNNNNNSGHHHHHGPGGHAHAAHAAHSHPAHPALAHHFSAAPLQPTQAGAGHFNVPPGQQQQQQPVVPPPPPLVSAGHHSGQINQPAGHHPLHAANTAAAHSHAAMAHHGHGHAHPPLHQAHLGGASANLLAQLHQQNQTTTNQQQAAAAGNVAAAVAALAAAAAATNHSQPPGSQSNSNNNNSSSSTLHHNSNNSNNLNQASNNNNNNAANSSINLHSLKQNAAATNVPVASASVASASSGNQVSTSAPNTSTTSFITAGGSGACSQPPGPGPPLPPPPPAHVVAAVAAAAATTTPTSQCSAASGLGTRPLPIGTGSSLLTRTSGQQQQFNLKSSSSLQQQQQQYPVAASSVAAQASRFSQQPTASSTNSQPSIATTTTTTSSSGATTTANPSSSATTTKR